MSSSLSSSSFSVFVERYSYGRYSALGGKSSAEQTRHSRELPFVRIEKGDTRVHHIDGALSVRLRRDASPVDGKLEPGPARTAPERGRGPLESAGSLCGRGSLQAAVIDLFRYQIVVYYLEGIAD